MSEIKMCPYCGEDIKIEAIKCKHCQSMLSKEDDQLVGAASARLTAPKRRKPIWQQWWAWVGAIIFLLFFIIIISSGANNETTPQRSNTTSTSSNQSSTTPTTDTPEPGETVASGNSRSNPAGINETFIVEKDDWMIGKLKYEVTLLETISGSKAWDIVIAANMFNSEPEYGTEYILAKFRVKVLSTESDEPYSINHAKFDVISSSGVEYTGFHSVAGLNPDLRADLYEGAEHVGWTYFIVNIDDLAPLAVMDRKDASEIWFKLRN